MLFLNIFIDIIIKKTCLNDLALHLALFRGFLICMFFYQFTYHFLLPATYVPWFGGVDPDADPSLEVLNPGCPWDPLPSWLFEGGVVTNYNATCAALGKSSNDLGLCYVSCRDGRLGFLCAYNIP